MKLLLPVDAGRKLGPEGHPIPASTLAWWRATGRGPKYIKVGRRVFYREDDLDAFIAAGLTAPEAA